MAISIDLAIGSVATSGGGGGGSVNTGVLQVSGGGALSSTLQTITDQSSNASPLQLSTTQVAVVAARNYNTFFVGGSAAACIKINQNSDSATDGIILGTNGANGSFASIGFGNSLTMTEASFTFNKATRQTFVHEGLFVGAGNTTPTASARLHVRGDGTNPIGRFENSTGAALLIGTGAMGNRIWSSNASSATLDFYTGGAVLTGQWGTGTGYSFSVANGLMQHISGTSGLLNLSGIFSVASGTGVFRPLSVEYTVSTAGTYSGTTTGIFLNAIESVSAGTHNLMDLQGGDAGGLSVFRVSKTRVSAVRFDTILRLGGGSDTSQHYIYGGEGNSTGIVLDRGDAKVGVIGVFETRRDTINYFRSVNAAASAFVDLQFDVRNAYYQFNAGNGLGLGITSGASARLHVKGAAASNIIYAEDSSAAQRFLVSSTATQIHADYNSNSGVYYGGGTSIRTITFHGNTSSVLQVNNNLDATWDALYLNSTQGTNTGSLLKTGITYTFSTGTNTAKMLNFLYTINNTGGTNTVNGIYLNATETSLTGTTHNLMDLQVGGVSRFRVTNGGDTFTRNRFTFIPNNDYFEGSHNTGFTTINSAQNIQLIAGSSFPYRFLSTGLVQFGGTTASFPALRVNGATLEVVLANATAGSGFANLSANALTAPQLTTSAISAQSGVNNGRVFIQSWDNTVLNVTNDGVAISKGVITVAHASAMLEVASTTRGFLPPRMTTAQRDLIASPAEGLLIYNTDTQRLNIFITSWIAVH